MSIFRGIYVFFRRIVSVKAMLKDPSVKLWKKALAVFGMVYLFLPVDLIPPVLIPIGWIDDLVVWILITMILRDTLDRYWSNGKKEEYSEKFTEAVDVDYEVKEENRNQEKENSKEKADSSKEKEATP